MQPTLAGFVAWVRLAMGIDSAILPDNSPFFNYAFQVAMALVNTQLQTANPLIYQLAVYNLGGDNLVNWAQDTPPSTYFKDLRTSFGCFNFTAGVVSSTSDEGTSSSYEIIKTMKDVTIGQLQNLKTPWGRQYLAFASEIGTNWGLS
jgi:hypothetical protein